MRLLQVSGGGLVVALLAAAVIIQLLIVRPIGAVTRSVQSVAMGDLTSPIMFSGQKDEVGVLARSLTTLRDNAIEAKRLEARQAALEAEMALGQKRAMHHYADGFEREIGGLVAALASAATEMRATAQSMSETAGHDQRRPARSRSATEEASAACRRWPRRRRS